MDRTQLTFYDAFSAAFLIAYSKTIVQRREVRLCSLFRISPFAPSLKHANRPNFLQWSAIWVCIRALKAKRRVPRVCCGAVPRAQGRDLRIRFPTLVLSLLVRLALVGELVTDAVCDDDWIQGLLLDGRDLRVDGLEGEFGGGTAAETAFEFNGWNAAAEVKTGDRGGGRVIGTCCGAT